MVGLRVGREGARSEMAWLSDSRVRVVPEPSQVDLDSRSDQARDGASFSRQNEHYREERENCRQTPKNLHPLTRPLWCRRLGVLAGPGARPCLRSGGRGSATLAADLVEDIFERRCEATLRAPGNARHRPVATNPDHSSWKNASVPTMTSAG